MMQCIENKTRCRLFNYEYSRHVFQPFIFCFRLQKMSSFRKAAPRRTHKERSQLGARTHMGLLEKKKDYKIRSADYHRKENAIKALKVKAEFRNPDEFYHKMISSSTKKGVHEVKQRVEKYDGDALKLLKSADLRYVLY